MMYHRCFFAEFCLCFGASVVYFWVMSLLSFRLTKENGKDAFPMKKLFALLLAFCLLFGTFAIAEEPVAENPVEETPVEATLAETEPTILENGWILTTEEVLEITEPLGWMNDKESIAFLAIMMMLDAYATEDFALESGKYYPQNAYVGVTGEGTAIVLYPSATDNTVLQLVYVMDAQQVSGMVIPMDPAPDDAMLTALMTQRCGVNVNKTDADTVTYILNQFAELSSK